MTQAASQPEDRQAVSSSSSRAAYVVLGMHRSGTSAITQVLALAGASLPENVMPGDEHNAKGYFEPWRIAVFNDQRLRAAGGAWDDPFIFPYRALDPREEKRWITRATDLFDEEFAGARHPLMKDPRVSVLGPLWRTVLQDLGLTARAVIPVRHPLEVAGSLAKRDGFPVEKSLLLWVAYMLGAENCSRDMPRAFVSYDGLLSDWRGQAARIEAAHGAPLPALTPKAAKAIDGFLTRELRHNAAADDLTQIPLVGPLAARVYAWFEAAASDQPRPAEELAAAARTLEDMRQSMGVFVSPVTSDLALARAELLEARQIAAFEQSKIRALEAQMAEHAAQAEAHRRLEGAVNDLLDDFLGES
ncbi:sulfotransferase family protein [Phenylobacterium sp.]|uniref:sulfotransferase family protein n=1 Tax=Phenylobacterium sp. TaxID=1871053 RepID=UPI002731D472|nr:hypothetical protein [Phenylobacterium sp.]MDP1874857.1 hypothetical protein [Phenylobacterium sp.]MDP3488671.1 hypothetical protein [Phenylobacterium sp.]